MWRCLQAPRVWSTVGRPSRRLGLSSNIQYLSSSGLHRSGRLMVDGARAVMVKSYLYLTPLSIMRRELALASLLAATGMVFLYGFGPAPGDAPAHLYRTFLV